MTEVTQDVSSVEQSSPVQLESAETEVSQKAESDSKEYNWKQLREAKRQLEEEVYALKGQIQAIAASQTSKELSAPEEELKDDDLVEVRHFKKALQEIRQELYNRDQASVPDKLKARYSDFEEIVSKENVEKLKATEPELYLSLTAHNDLYTKGIAAYKMLKNLGYGKADQYEEEKERIQKNTRKPQSVSSVGVPSAIHGAHNFEKGLTPELRKALLDEMVEASKRS